MALARILNRSSGAAPQEGNVQTAEYGAVGSGVSACSAPQFPAGQYCQEKSTWSTVSGTVADAFTLIVTDRPLRGPVEGEVMLQFGRGHGGGPLPVVLPTFIPTRTGPWLTFPYIYWIPLMNAMFAAFTVPTR